MTHERPDGFSLRLEFSTLAQFAEFVAILRGGENSDEQITAMTARLQRGTADLAAAEHDDRST